MGSSSSKSKIVEQNNTLVMTENDVNSVNQQLNNFVANAVVNAASSCSASVNQSSKISIRNLEAKGDINLNTSTVQTSVVDFSCINVTQVRNDIANQLITQMMSSIENNNSADVLAKMNATAASKTTQGAGSAILNPFSKTSNKSDVEQINNYQQYTKNNTNIENIIKNSVEVGFTSNTLNSCISSVSQQADYQAENLKAGGNITLVNSVQQGTQLMAKCVNSTDVGNSVTSNVLNYFGVQVKSDTETKVASESTGTATSESKSAGVNDIISSVGTAIGSIFGGIFGSIFGALGLTALGPMAGPSSSSSSLCSCICICCILILMVLFGSGIFSSSGTTP